MIYCMVNFQIEYASKIFMPPVLRRCYLFTIWIFFVKICHRLYETKLALYDEGSILL